MIERIWPPLRQHWFTILVAIVAVAAAIELVARRDSAGAPTISLWIGVPLLVVMIAPLFWYRRFPLARLRPST